ncbi:AraC family transcriptional regulator [Phaeobacter sp. HF9A]|uniref:AraC family transcriptional regulator n=1 Tax=Phaeobacter sp. HF9A TaxID=2721561 RepID=UPI00142FF1A4|nr:AraC family transcriptional regulator [Phaeobacter sp. HF9A]NIZ12949.1 helix-turn-helix transcriptional regulator [Phaeobacter sp. HF9A]
MDFYDALHLDFSGPESAVEAISRLTSSRVVVVTAITSVPDPVLICEKLFRLERYCSSATRLALEEVTETSLRLRPLAAPVAREVPLRLAIVQALLQRAGFHGISVAPPELRWRKAPALPRLATSKSERLTDHVHQLIKADPARAWRIGEAAAHLDLSRRSLQRYLLAEGGSFSEVLRQARTDVAQSLLRKPGCRLGEVGYCCGYADQAHFQREFRRVTGLTPRQFQTSARR